MLAYAAPVQGQALLQDAFRWVLGQFNAPMLSPGELTFINMDTDVNVYLGPGRNYGSVASTVKGRTVHVRGRTQDGE